MQIDRIQLECANRTWAGENEGARKTFAQTRQAMAAAMAGRTALPTETQQLKACLGF